MGKSGEKRVIENSHLIGPERADTFRKEMNPEEQTALEGK
jgi:hypothetical protein